MTSLELIWNCGENDKDAGYKTAEHTISDMGAQVVHLWDRRARYFYGYRVRISRTGRGGFRDIGAEYQTLGAALLAGTS
jgi:hypothetical protein